jgi:hypothetical protein
MVGEAADLGGHRCKIGAPNAPLEPLTTAVFFKHFARLARSLEVRTA